MRTTVIIAMGAAMFLAAGMTQAAITIPTVSVGDPGNAGELSGSGAGGYGPDRICGAVAYTYNIGTFEITTGQYTAFLNAVAATDAYDLYNPSMWSGTFGCQIQRSGSSGSYSYSVASDYANRPVNYVSWGDSARFANWLHNGQPTGAQSLSTTENGAYYLDGATSNEALRAVTRKAEWRWAIASEDEWYKAAYYKGGGTNAGYWDFPTSGDTVPGYVNNAANLSTTGNPFVEGGTDPGNYATYDGDGETYGIGSPYYVTVVGEWENSASPYGTFDQGGNVWEWNETSINVRAGSFHNDNVDCLRAFMRSSSGYPTYEDWDIGFRVSAVPEPASLSLLALAGLAVIRKRRSGNHRSED